MATYNDAALEALGHIRRFLVYNKDETLTGYHDAYEKIKVYNRQYATSEKAEAQNKLIMQVLNLAHDYANQCDDL